MLNEEYTLALLEKQVRETINKEIDKISKELKKQIPAKITQVKQEIFGSFQAIVYTEVQKFFLKTYGPNYDVDSLNSSLTFTIGNDLRPDFSYDKNKFVFTPSLNNNTRAFNQNSSPQTKFSSIIYEPDFNSFEEYDIYYDDNPFDNAYNSIYNSIDDRYVFKPHNKALKQGGFTPLKDAYDKARIQALQEYNIYYKKVLLPQIFKKYGIKIN